MFFGFRPFGVGCGHNDRNSKYGLGHSHNEHSFSRGLLHRSRKVQDLPEHENSGIAAPVESHVWFCQRRTIVEGPKKPCQRLIHFRTRRLWGLLKSADFNLGVKMVAQAIVSFFIYTSTSHQQPRPPGNKQDYRPGNITHHHHTMSSVPSWKSYFTNVPRLTKTLSTAMTAMSFFGFALRFRDMAVSYRYRNEEEIPDISIDTEATLIHLLAMVPIS